MEKKKLKKKAKVLLIVIISLASILIISAFSYIFLSRPVDKTSTANIEVTIKRGMRTSEIAKLLKERGLIRSELVFTIATKFNREKTLKAATYQLQKNMSLNEVIDVLTAGSKYNPDIIRITFKEGEPLKKYALEISTYTNNTYEDVINTVSDYNYLTELINNYWFLTDEILNTNLYFGLEGYLFPDTYEFANRKVSVKKVIETMLNRTEKELKGYKDDITSSNKTPHQILTLASMLELEGKNKDDRKMIAGVFNNRLEKNMNLGSDVTTYYALQKEMKADLTAAEFATINPYNTRASNMGGKLPVGPICNPSASSIDASINPTDNNYLFFVADKKGKIYYAKTEIEHQELISEIKSAGNWIW